MLQNFPQDEVVMVNHLHFRQASAETNSPGQGSFVLSAIQEVIAALGNFGLLECLKNAL